MALVIGLTGGIGSGKSTVAHYFSQLGVPVIDADDVARALCLPHQAVFEQIVARFGNSMLAVNGEIDRRKLRKTIFENSVERCWLESVLHPRIIEIILSWINKLEADYCIVVAPLLFETAMKDHVDRILVVDACEKEQIQRAVYRDETSQQDIEIILTKQLSRDKKLELADDVIVNDSGIEELKRKVDELNQFYVKLVDQG